MKEQTKRALRAIADNPAAHSSVRQWALDALAGKRPPLDPNIVYPDSPDAPGPFPQEEP